MRASWWAGIVVFVCAALVVVALPPAAPTVAFGEVRRDYTPERLRFVEAREDLLVAQEALRRRRWVDSLVALVHGVGERPERLVVGAQPDPGSPERMRSELDRLAEDARGELVRLDVARPAVDLGVFTLPLATDDAERPVRLLRWRAVEWYAGEAGGRPYCLAVHLVEQVTWSNVRAEVWSEYGPDDPNILGPCGFYARYGMPGAAVQRWMLSDGAGLGLARGPERIWSEPVPNTRYFRMRATVDYGDMRVESCLKGSAESCRLIFTDYESGVGTEIDMVEQRIVAAGIPLLESEYDAAADYGNSAGAYILDGLERQFGADAFGKFWRSNQPVTVAFQDAFDISPADWVFDWASSLEGASVDMNTMPRGRESGLMILYTLVGLALAVGVATRRRVG